MTTEATAVTTDQVAALITLMQQQQTDRADNGAGTKIKTKRPDRPVINAGIDDREWALFDDAWSRYKKMVGVTATDVEAIRMELRACCSTDVNRMLFEFVGKETLDTCSEEDLLTHIKSVAVEQVHPEVHQMNFNTMRQNPGEPIAKFVARLKSQACLCKFEVKCSCTPGRTVSYAENMVAQRLVAGLRNVDHQRKILSEATTLTTLEAKVTRLQLFETTEKSAAALHERPATVPLSSVTESSAARSQYKQEQAASKMQGAPSEDPAKCRGCGQAPHVGGRSKCFASKKTCRNCGIKGHIASVCQKSRSSPINDDSLHGAEPESNDVENLEPIMSGANVSFAFGAQQDFRLVRKKGANR